MARRKFPESRPEPSTESESAKAAVSGATIEINVLVNSGVLIGDSMDHANEAMETTAQKHQIKVLA